jgi:predicted nucleotidyltransferase
MLKSGGSIGEYIPRPASEVYDRETGAGRRAIYIEDIEQGLLARLRHLTFKEIMTVPDATEELANRLLRAVKNCGSVYEILSEAKTKRYAMSRLRRLIICACLGISSDMTTQPIPYARLLAANERGCELLREIQTKAATAIITKPAFVKQLPEMARRVFEIESSATDFYVLGHSSPEDRRAGSEYRTSPVII